VGVDPSECLVFEDAPAGAKSAKSAGCVVVAVPDPRMDKSVFKGDADVVLDDMWHFDGRPWGIDIDMKTQELPN
jgi:beta-phosphoglucomutase-like phosphatase (HAD superfamily)